MGMPAMRRKQACGDRGGSPGFAAQHIPAAMQH
jgi:hypothetical protein